VWSSADNPVAELEQPAEVVLNSVARDKAPPNVLALRRYTAALTSEMPI